MIINPKHSSSLIFEIKLFYSFLYLSNHNFINPSLINKFFSTWVIVMGSPASFNINKPVSISLTCPVDEKVHSNGAYD
jgi:hypothetical protein